MTDPQFVLVGAAPSTRNLGVSALLLSAVQGIHARCPTARLTVLDFGKGSGPLELGLPDGTLEVRRVAASHSRRLWAPECFRRMRAEARLGLAWTPAGRAIAEADAVFDVSGGDSFTDLYGVKRFWTTMHPKLLAEELGTRLVLLPQTYGPFEEPRLEAVAKRAVQAAAAAWARDERSHATLRELAGERYEPARHGVGVDMAFGLVPRDPGRSLSPELDAWRANGETLAGINVSGLIHSDPAAARTRYGFRADYSALVRGLVEGLVERGAKVVLVPHVLAPAGRPESDPEACARLRAELPQSVQGSVCALQPPYDASEVKHVIASLDWFNGTRMHSTIAGLSAGVPTTAIAYSLKFQGVFESVDSAAGVIDPRALETAPALEALLHAFEGRQAAGERLRSALPAVRDQAREQLDALCRAALAGPQ